MAQLHAAWTEQLGALAQCFLHFKTGNPPSMPLHILNTKKVLTVSTSCALIYLVSYSKISIQSTLVTLIQQMGNCFNVPQEATDIYPSFSLMHAGYLLPTPSDPQVAFSI